MAASFLQNLPTSGLLAQISEKIVRRVGQQSPRRHIQTRDSAEGEDFQIVQTDKTNILIRSLQQNRRRPGGSGCHTEAASAAQNALPAPSGDKGKKRAFDASNASNSSARLGDFTKRQLVCEKTNTAIHSTQQSRTGNQIIFQDSERRDEGLHHPTSTAGCGKEKTLDIVQENILSSAPQQESSDVLGGTERAIRGGKSAKDS